MKKFFLFTFALLLSFGQIVSADVQIDEGQTHGTAAVKFFIARNGRQTIISADRVVVWDSTSKDGVTVTTTTTSEDRLVAGITMDLIPGVSSDSVTTDVGNNNWGRVQTWGLHNNVVSASGSTGVAGDNVCSSTTAGSIASCNTASADNASVGIAMEAITGAAGTIDIMVQLD